MNKKPVAIPAKAHYEKGADDGVALVFSCPGCLEKAASRPCVGQTGVNHTDLSLILIKDYAFSGLERGQVTITNAWDKPLSRKENFKSQASLTEVLTSANLKRLYSELNSINEIIICFGDVAEAAVGKIKKRLIKHKQSLTFIFVPHLGNVGLNVSIKKDIYENALTNYKKAKDKPIHEVRSIKQIGFDNRRARLQVVAEKIASAIGAMGPQSDNL